MSADKNFFEMTPEEREAHSRKFNEAFGGGEGAFSETEGSKRVRWAKKICDKLAKKGLLELDDEGRPMVDIQEAATHSVYAVYHLKNGKEARLRLADHAPNMHCNSNFWCEKYKDAEEYVFEEAGIKKTKQDYTAQHAAMKAKKPTGGMKP